MSSFFQADESDMLKAVLWITERWLWFKILNDILIEKRDCCLQKKSWQISYQRISLKYSDKLKIFCESKSSWTSRSILVLFRKSIICHCCWKTVGAGFADDRAIPSNFNLFLNLAIVQMHFATDARRRDDWRHLLGPATNKPS